MQRIDLRTLATRQRILTFLLAGLILAACARETAQPPEQQVVEEAPRPWAILHALAVEGEELRGSASIVTDAVWAGRPVAVGWIVQPMVIAKTGVGTANAAATTQHVIDTYKPAGIIFTGVCGAIDPRLRIGDIVIPDQWVTHDFGYYGARGFEVDSIPVGRFDSTGFDRMMEIAVDTNLARRLEAAANATAFHFRTVGGILPEIYRGGVGVSGNAFIGSQSKRKQLNRDLEAQIVDMESAAVVQTAHAAGVPVVIVRACSDLAGGGSGTAEEEFRENFETAAYNAAMVVKEFLETKE
jgi:adenosylhomocysteine nucleosidase